MIVGRAELRSVFSRAEAIERSTSSSMGSGVVKGVVEAVEVDEREGG
jgi:hypothetical protein